MDDFGNRAGRATFFERISRLFGKIDRKDAVLLLVSFVVSFGIWMTHNLSLNYSRVVRVPVEASSNIDGRAPLSQNAAVVQMRCRTTGFNLVRLSRMEKGDPVQVAISSTDLHHMGGDSYFITSAELNQYVKDILGGESLLESFVSDTLVFRFPAQNSRKVPVVPSCTPSYRTQYTSRDGIQVSPDSILIYGEPYLIDNIDRVLTERFTLDELKSSRSGDVKLVKIKNVRMSQEKVDYSIDVSRFVELTYDFPVLSRNVPSNRMLLIYPSTATVSFKCAFPVTVHPEENVRVWVDYKDFSASLSGKCIPEIAGIGDGILSYSVDPQVFECIESSR